MKTLALVVFISFGLISSVAFAAPLKQEEVDAAKKKCHEIHPGKSTGDVLLLGHCLTSVDIKVLEIKRKEGDTKVASEIELLRMQMRSLELQIKQQERLLKKAAKAEESKTPEPATPQAQPPRPSLPPVAGYQVIDAPGRYSASTVDSPEFPSRVRIRGLWFAAQKLINWNIPEARVVFLKNGIPLAVTHPGARPFNEFYADLNRDGKPDPTPYKGVDPTFVDSVFIPFQPGDKIEIVYLTNTQKLVAVNGLPPLPLWGHGKKMLIDNLNTPGKWMYWGYEGVEL